MSANRIGKWEKVMRVAGLCLVAGAMLFIAFVAVTAPMG